jgi:erythronate-4-phosphate dehydrogenase
LNKNLLCVLDVWENEPDLNLPLLDKVQIATPHIAGYSVEGKINGTIMIYKALCKSIGYDPGWRYSPVKRKKNLLEINSTGIFEKDINSIISQVYKITSDDSDLRKVLEMSRDDIAIYFDLLRKNYNLRKEFFNYDIDAASWGNEIKRALKSLRFNLLQ